MNQIPILKKRIKLWIKIKFKKYMKIQILTKNDKKYFKLFNIQINKKLFKNKEKTNLKY